MTSKHEADRATDFVIGNRSVGAGHESFVVAEVAQAHDGSLGAAHAYIDAVADTGVDAVKFQTHIASAESTPAEPWRDPFSRQDATRYDYWKRMEFSSAQWEGLARHAEERGLIFLSSPFSREAVDLLERVGVPAWKVGAGEIPHLDLIETIAKTGKPVLLSNGLCTWDELDAAVACARDHHAPFGVYQCTSAYPCPPDKIGLNVLDELRGRYRCPVGLSDHSGTLFAGLAAVSLGADMIEVHVTFSRQCFGPDVRASLTIEELGRFVEGVRFIETVLAHPVDKGTVAGDIHELRAIFTRSIVATKDLRAGHRLTRQDLALKKPGTGLPPARLAEVVGWTLSRDVSADTLLAEEDLKS